MVDSAQSPEAGETPPGQAASPSEEGAAPVAEEPSRPKPTETLEYWKSKARNIEGQYKAAAAKAKQFDDLTESQKSETERLSSRAENAERERDAERSARLRLEVAVEKGLVGERAALADRLRGNSKEELLADADTLLALLPPPGSAKVPNLDVGARASQPASSVAAGRDRYAAWKAARAAG